MFMVIVHITVTTWGAFPSLTIPLDLGNMETNPYLSHMFKANLVQHRSTTRNILFELILNPYFKPQHSLSMEQRRLGSP